MDALKMVKLDFYSIKTQAIGSAILTVAVLAVFGFMSSSYDALGITCAWIVPLSVTSLFQVQEKDSLDRLYATLSLKQRDIVYGRYVSILAAYALALAASLVIFAGFALYHRVGFDPVNLFFGISFSLLIFSLIAGVQIPLNFKFGYTKARFISLIPLYIVLLVVVLPMFFIAWANLFSFVFENQATLIPVYILVSVVAMVLSYRISLAAYKNRR